MASGSERAQAVLTPLELQIMQALWDGGPGTVGEVRARLAAPLAYTTVQTMLGVLLKKLGRTAESLQDAGFRDTRFQDIVEFPIPVQPPPEPGTMGKSPVQTHGEKIQGSH